MTNQRGSEKCHTLSLTKNNNTQTTTKTQPFHRSQADDAQQNTHTNKKQAVYTYVNKQSPGNTAPLLTLPPSSTGTLPPHKAQAKHPPLLTPWMLFYTNLDIYLDGWVDFKSSGSHSLFHFYFGRIPLVLRSIL